MTVKFTNKVSNFTPERAAGYVNNLLRKVYGNRREIQSIFVNAGLFVEGTNYVLILLPDLLSNEPLIAELNKRKYKHHVDDKFNQYIYLGF